jgi:hypothetical protein
MQCAIPAFDGLLPEPHNKRLLKLLFDLAHWHGLAKLRMHTDVTLGILSQVTTSLGNSFRDFQEKTCATFQTRELERERAARERLRDKSNGRPRFTTSSHSTGESMAVAVHRTGQGLAGASREGAGESVNAADHSTGPTPASAPSTGTGESANATNPSSEQEPPARKGTRKQKHLSLNTYTYHALGDYVKTISHLGTTDSYSTQSVSFRKLTLFFGLLTNGGHQGELEHRTSKARFSRTSGRSIPLQLSRMERRQRHIRAIREKLHRPLSQTGPDAEDAVNNPQMRYNIGKTQNAPVHVPTFLQKNAGDPATKASDSMFSFWSPLY